QRDNSDYLLNHDGSPSLNPCRPAGRDYQKSINLLTARVTPARVYRYILVVHYRTEREFLEPGALNKYPPD
ncbi:MAG: hypothetical protein ACO25D_09620, partial [Burkholderiaceae bacterium]